MQRLGPEKLTLATLCSQKTLPPPYQELGSLLGRPSWTRDPLALPRGNGVGHGQVCQLFLRASDWTEDGEGREYGMFANSLKRLKTSWYFCKGTG